MRNFYSLFIGLALLCSFLTAFGQLSVRTTHTETDDYMEDPDTTHLNI